MSEQTTRLVISAVLLVHALGHLGALAALVWIGRRPSSRTGGWQQARSWLIRSLSSDAATRVAAAFWVASLVGFLATVAALWLVPGDLWRGLAVGSALVSTVGIMLFLGTWPLSNTVAALAVNGAVLVSLLALGWPSVIA